MKTLEWILPLILIAIGAFFVLLPMPVWRVFRSSFDLNGMELMASIYSRLEKTWVPQILIRGFGAAILFLGCMFLWLKIQGK